MNAAHKNTAQYFQPASQPSLSSPNINSFVLARLFAETAAATSLLAYYNLTMRICTRENADKTPQQELPADGVDVNEKHFHREPPSRHHGAPRLLICGRLYTTHDLAGKPAGHGRFEAYKPRLSSRQTTP